MQHWLNTAEKCKYIYQTIAKHIAEYNKQLQKVASIALCTMPTFEPISISHVTQKLQNRPQTTSLPIALCFL
jgi:hypothetical protein